MPTVLEVVFESGNTFQVQYWIALTYIAALLIARRWRGTTWLDQIAWTAFYLFAVHMKTGLPRSTWILWLAADFLLSVVCSKRVVFGSRRRDLLWYGAWLAIIVCASSLAELHAASVDPIWAFDAAKFVRPLGENESEALVAYIVIVASAVLLRDLYQGYLPWFRKSRFDDDAE